MNEIRDSPVFKPLTPRCRRSTKSEEKSYSHNNSQEHMEDITSRKQKLNTSENGASDYIYENYAYNYSQKYMEDISKQNLDISENKAPFKDDNDRQIKRSSDEHIKGNETKLSAYSQNDFSSKLSKFKKNSQLPINKQDINSSSSISYRGYFFSFIIILIIAILFGSKVLCQSEKQTQSINNPTSLFESIEEIKAKFYNQDSDIWNEISSAINEIISRNPKVPQIILLFANETTTMDCLATALADISSTALNIDSPLNYNPKNFGDDAGKIIDSLSKHSPAKKVVIIRNVLNINAEAIKALHNLCDKENPLIREAIYIFTMQINNYQSSQKKLKIIEDQFYHKLSKSIDEDILMALVTRITDGAIISVQPEPHLRYC